MNKLGILNKTTVPINLHPKFDSEMTDEGLYGMVVKILEELEDDWYYVETHYDYAGYVHGTNMIIDTVKAEEWKNRANNIISYNIADVMPNPTYKGYIKEILTKGAIIEVTGAEVDNWAEIILADGTNGWVRKDFVSHRLVSYDKLDEVRIRENLVKTALSYLGTQYRWGGKSPIGLDCSGLCSISYLLNGIIIYRDAIRKDEYMRSITLDEIKSGDLIFFPGHVAMYIGDNKYVHSSSSLSGVGINSLDSIDPDYNQDLRTSIIDIGTAF